MSMYRGGGEELCLWRAEGGGHFIPGRGATQKIRHGLREVAGRYSQRRRMTITSAYRAAQKAIAECVAGGTYQDEDVGVYENMRTRRGKRQAPGSATKQLAGDRALSASMGKQWRRTGRILPVAH